MTVDTDPSAEALPMDPTRELRSFRPREQACNLVVSWKLLWALAAVGGLVRTVQYAANRSLWFDEAALGLNLLERSFGRLLSPPLDFGQAAPVGFLIVERSAADVFGYSEYALRLFPLVCGFVALAGFVFLARRVLTPFTAPLAVGLFALAQGPAYYSSELKPYAVDVAATILLLLAGVSLIERSQGKWTALGIGGSGIVLTGFSFPSILVLAAAAIAVAAKAAQRGPLAGRLLLALTVWACGMAAAGIFALTQLSAIRNGFKLAADTAIGPGVVFNLHALNVFASGLAAGAGLEQEAPWNQLQKLAALAALVGAGSLLIRAPIIGLMVLLPIPLTLVAAALDQYPLTRRTTLFLVPIVILALAEGIARLSAWAPRRSRPLIATGLTVMIGVGPAWWSAKAVLHPPKHEELRPVLAYVRDHWRPGDTLYIHYEAQYAFLYYKECGCLALTGRDGAKLWPAVPGPGGRELYSPAVKSKSRSILIGPSTSVQAQLADLNRLRGRRRVWFVYSHLYGSEPGFVKQRLLGRLDEMGVRVAKVIKPGAYAYLYRLEASAS
jgi:hypothetical protein